MNPHGPAKTYRRKLDLKHGRVDMSHGAGGRAMADLIAGIFRVAFANEWLDQGNDQASFLTPTCERMVMTTDGYVVSPLFFPGGDIGSLAVHGTINDLAMAGARPLYLSASFIIEEGFAFSDLKRIAEFHGAGGAEAGVPIVTGDTKVVERGKGGWRFHLDRRHRHRSGRYLAGRRPGGSRRRRADLRFAGRSWRRHHVVQGEPGVRNRNTVRQRRLAWSGRRHGRGGRSASAAAARSDARRTGRNAQRTGAPVRRRIPHR